jgi:AraC family transcriptional regulator
MSTVTSLEQLVTAVTELLHALNCALEAQHESTQERVGSAAARTQPQPIRGGLAPWQQRALRAHIDSHLDGSIRNRDLAQLVNLSTYHFIRAFGESFGQSPHQYVLSKRMQRAQELMLSTSASLSQIAISCGLSDQAHLTRHFRKAVGESPGAWRRARGVLRMTIAPAAHAPRTAPAERILA